MPVTRAANADAHPGCVLLDGKQKKRSRQQIEEDTALAKATAAATRKEAKAKHRAAIVTIATTENSIEQEEKDLQAHSARPDLCHTQLSGSSTLRVPSSSLEDEMPDKPMGSEIEDDSSDAVDVDNDGATELAPSPKASTVRALSNSGSGLDELQNEFECESEETEDDAPSGYAARKRAEREKIDLLRSEVNAARTVSHAASSSKKHVEPVRKPKGLKRCDAFVMGGFSTDWKAKVKHSHWQQSARVLTSCQCWEQRQFITSSDGRGGNKVETGLLHDYGTFNPAAGGGPEASTRDVHTWRKTFLPLLHGWAGTQADPFGANCQMEGQIVNIWKCAFPSVALDQHDREIVLNVCDNVLNNWRSDIGKAGYHAVSVLWKQESTRFSSAKDIRELEFCVQVPRENYLVSKVYASHLRKTSPDGGEYGPQIGGLALATVAVERGLTLFETGEDILKLDNNDGRGATHVRGYGFTDKVWGSRAHAVVMSTQRLKDSNWAEIQDHASVYLQGTDHDEENGEDSGYVKAGAMSLHAQIEIDCVLDIEAILKARVTRVISTPVDLHNIGGSSASTAKVRGIWSEERRARMAADEGGNNELDV
ncbi:hypothetical protein H4582DRAFT_2056409 [Lactarius indigo]|nr:hypothetical protein H4582DRAFT_2056409 [Lactarius indigo]